MTPRARLRLVGGRQVLELVLDGVIGFQHALATADALQRFRQAVIGLRPDDEIDRRCPAQDLVAFRLRHAAGHADHYLAPFARLALLQIAQPAKRRVDLFGRLFANMAGV